MATIHDPLLRRLGATLPDGRRFKGGVLISPGDAAAADATRARDAALDAEARRGAIQTGPAPASLLAPTAPSTGASPAPLPGAAAPIPHGMPPGYDARTGGINVNNYVGSRYDPAFLANNPQFAPKAPESEAVQVARIQAEGARAQRESVGFGSYEEASRSLPPGVSGKITQDTKTGRWMVTDAGQAPVDRTGTRVDVGGVPMYWQNNNQVAPLPDPKTQPQYFETPKVTETGGFRFYQTGPGEAPRPLREPDAGGGLNPLVVGSMTQKLTTLEQELAEHQAKIVSGDNRYGFGNVKSRAERVKELEAEIAGTRAMLRGGGGGGGGGAPAAQPAAAPAPAAPAKPAQPAAAATPPAKLYTIADKQVSFAPGADLLKAAQQAVDDGVISADSARELLAKNGYKPKTAKPADKKN